MILFALACTTGPVEPTPVATEPDPARVVLFVRHAEKAKDGTPDPPLTEAGVARAACLADVLAYAQPLLIVTSEYQRTRMTAAPTAERFGLEPMVIPADAPEKTLEVLRQLKPGGTALVTGHSNTIPQLVAELGGSVFDLDDKGYIPDSSYDRLVTVTLDAAGRATSSTTTRYCMTAPALPPEARPPPDGR